MCCQSVQPCELSLLAAYLQTLPSGDLLHYELSQSRLPITIRTQASCTLVVSQQPHHALCKAWERASPSGALATAGMQSTTLLALTAQHGLAQLAETSGAHVLAQLLQDPR